MSIKTWFRGGQPEPPQQTYTIKKSGGAPPWWDRPLPKPMDASAWGADASNVAEREARGEKGN